MKTDTHTDIQFRTLFHGNQGNRVIPIDEWTKADQKVVHDGTAGTEYLSGWHIIPTRDDAEEYLTRFKKKRPNELTIVRVWAQGVRRKNHSRSPIYLAEWIYLGVWPNEP